MNALEVRVRLTRLVRGTRAAAARVLGVPDYDAYLAHVAAAHPGAQPLEREQFMRERLNARYSKVGARCC
jgi:uncharacterized short protein YbdD (DUF466 family)